MTTITTVNSDSAFVNFIDKSLKEGNTIGALNEFNDNRNDLEIENNSWDLIPIITQYFTPEHASSNEEVFNCCKQLVNIIADKAVPQETLLQFIEEVETAKNDLKFKILMNPLRTVALKSETRRLTSTAWCFNAIQTYLNQLEISEVNEDGDEEEEDSISDTTVNRICELYVALFTFYDVFIEEIETNNNIKQIRRVVTAKFLIQLLGKPLAYLNMDFVKSNRTKVRTITEKIILEAVRIIYNPYIFLEMRDETYNSELIKPSAIGLGIFYYLLLSEEMCFNLTPKIYNPIYILQSILYLVNNFFEDGNSHLRLKGFKLMSSLLKLVGGIPLSYLLLDSVDHYAFCRNLTNIVIYNDTQETRKYGLGILERYLWGFETQGRYLLISNLISSITHNGLIGYLITQYKEMMKKEITNNYENISIYFSGRKLYDMLERFCMLKNNGETDIVEYADQIISTLNFLRYLFLADVDGKTGIFNVMGNLEVYFQQLQESIVFCNNSYKSKINELKSENKENRQQRQFDDGDDGPNIAVSVQGQSLSQFNTFRQIEVLNMSLTTIDVVSSLLNRLLEII